MHLKSTALLTILGSQSIISETVPDCNSCSNENCLNNHCDDAHTSCYFPNTEDAHSFYQCSNGTPYLMPCATPLCWNADPFVLTCDYCPDPVPVVDTTTTLAPTTTTDSSVVYPDCDACGPSNCWDGDCDPMHSSCYWPAIDEPTSFYMCPGSHKMNCAPGTQWSQSELTCVHVSDPDAPEVPTEAPTTTLAPVAVDCNNCESANCWNGDCENYSCYFEDSSNQAAFYQCSNGVPYHFDCPAGTCFNTDPAILTCDWCGEAPETPAPTTEAPIASTEAPLEPVDYPVNCDDCDETTCYNGNCEEFSCYLSDPESENNFYQCNHGIPVSHSCGDLCWDESILTCNFCAVPEPVTTEAPEVTTTELSNVCNSCETENYYNNDPELYPCYIGDVQDGQNGFWKCDHGHAFWFDCPAGTVWEGAPIWTCNWEPETTEGPVVTTEAPVEPTEAPVVTTEAPIVTTEAPVVTTEAPVETTEAPVETTEAPVVTTEAPVVTTEAPVETTTEESDPCDDCETWDWMCRITCRWA